MTDDLTDAVLAAGVDDWVPLLTIDGLARRCSPSSGMRERQHTILLTLHLLLKDGLIELGEVTSDGFLPIDASPDACRARAERAFEQQDPDQWGFALWTSNTERGDEVGRVALAARSESP